jgi:hypothetical protein
MRHSSRLFVLLVLVASLVLGGATIVFAAFVVPTVRYVGAGQTYATIQSAIDAAVPYDTIDVAAGTYAESVNVNKPVTIDGAGAATIVDPADGSVGFRVTADGATIKDLKVTAYGAESIGVWNADDVTIDNVDVDMTGGAAGVPGIFVRGSDPRNGSVGPSDRLKVVKSRITVEGSCNGLFASDSSPAHTGWIIGGSALDANTIISLGGGNPLEMYDVTASEVSYNTFTNSAMDGTAVIWGSELSDISDLTFTNNVSSGSGGSMVAFLTDYPYPGDGNAVTTITGVTVTDNTFSNWGSRALRIGDALSGRTDSVTGIVVNSNTFQMTADTSEVIGGTATDKSGTGNTFNVTLPAKIQTAIDSAFAGDTIDVAAGTYAESVNVNKDVTIDGAGVTTIVEPASGSGFTVTADGATIKDLRINTDVAEAIAIKAADDVTIDNVDIEKGPSTATDRPGIFVFGTGSGSGGSTCASSDRLTIINSTINVAGENNGIYASNTSPAHTGWLIGGIGNGNIITTGGTPLELHDVTASTVSYNAITGGAGAGGTPVIWNSNLSDIATIVFNNNTVSGGSGSQVAFIADFFYPDVVDTTVTGVTISGNTFSNWGSRALRIGMDGVGRVSGVTATQNKFLGTGLVLTNAATDASVVTADHNWWGVAMPVWADTVSGAVTYNPWWINVEMTILNTTPPAAAYVDDSYTPLSAGGHIWGYDAFATMQGGVDAVASAGTVDVAAGTYTESVNVNRHVHIDGAGATTVVDPANDSVGFAVTADGATIKDLKVTAYGAESIGIWNADDVTIDNVDVDMTGGLPLVPGIYVRGTDPARGGVGSSDRLKVVKSRITVPDSCNGLFASDTFPAHTGWTIGGSALDANIIICLGGGNPLEMYDVTDSTVSYNTFTNEVANGTAVIWGSELSNIGSLVFTNNTASGSGGSLVSFLTDYPYGLAPATTITGVTVTDNTFSNWGSRALRIGDALSGRTDSVTGIVVSSNTFQMTADTPEVIGGTATGKSGTGNTFNVNVPAKIQTAIDSAFAGDTINVAAGTYAESVSLNKDVTIDGAGWTTIVAPASGAGFTVTAAGATIKDLRINTDVAEAIAIKAADDVTIDNVDIEKGPSTATDRPGIFVFGTGSGSGGSTCASSDNLTITNSTINVTGENNGIYASNTSPAHTGWLIGDNTITTGGTPLELHDVTASTVSYNAITGGAGAGGTPIIWNSNLSDIAGIVFCNNTVSGGSGSQVAFIADFFYPDGVDTTITGVTIQGNTFSNWDTRALRFGMADIGRVSGVTATQNKFMDTGKMVLTNAAMDASVVTADHNWWGVAMPVWANTVSGAVVYSPWWVNVEMTILNTSTYTVTPTATTHGTLSSAKTVSYGTDATFTVAPDTGYHVVRVWLDADTDLTASGGVYTVANVTADHTVSATFAIDTFTLTYSAVAHGTITGTSPQTVDYGSNGTTVTATPATGYHFVSWSDGVLTAERRDLDVTANVSATAFFAINTYTLTYTAGINGTISGTSPQTVSHGGNGTLVTAVPNADYHFVSWSDGVSTAARTDTNVAANVNATANFAIDTFTLTYTAVAHGTISGASPQTVSHGGNGTLVTAVPNAGYHFVSWSDGVSTAARTDTNVTANHTVSATFAIDTFTLTYTAGAHGTISGTSPQTVDYGSNGTTVTATPATGYHFVSWSDGVFTVARKDTNVTGNVNATATFAINTSAITPLVGAHGSISPATPQTVDYGADATFTITPAAGYHVADVVVDGVSVGAMTSYTFHNVTVGHTISATFAFTLIRTTVSIVANHSSVLRGHSVYFHGVVKPNRLNGTHVRFYRRKAGSSTWTLVSTRHVFSSHHWNYYYHPATRGTYYFQVRLSATSKYAASTSKTIKVIWR